MKNLSEVIEYTKINNGVSFNPYYIQGKGNFNTPSEGYCISQNGFEYKDKNLYSGLSYYVSKYAKLLSENKDIFLGIWLNKLDGNYYFDISTNVIDLQSAIKIGMKNKQIAIFDLQNSKEIVLPTLQKGKTFKQVDSYINSCAKKYAETNSFYTTY